jgi:hypothetical protein
VISHLCKPAIILKEPHLNFLSLSIMGKKGFECEIPDLTKLSAEFDYFFPEAFQTGFIKIH